MALNTGFSSGILAWSAVLCTFGGSLRAQSAGLHEPEAQLHADVTMILLPVTVMDRRGAVVNGLRGDSLAILDDKVPQKITSFSSDDLPCSVGLVLDISASMRNQLQSAKEALAEFLKSANPSDEFDLFGVTTRPVVYATAGSVENFTSDTGTILDTIRQAAAGGDTALVDTIYAALLKMRRARNPRRALFIVSDGMDNNSRYSKEELIRLAVEADVQVHTIGIFTGPLQSKAIQQGEARNGVAYLEDISAKTGGISFLIRSRKEAATAAERIGLAIRNQYVIGFQPQTLDQTGKWHRVKVTLDRDRVQVYARSGYYAR